MPWLGVPSLSCAVVMSAASIRTADADAVAGDVPGVVGGIAVVDLMVDQALHIDGVDGDFAVAAASPLSRRRPQDRGAAPPDEQHHLVRRRDLDLMAGDGVGGVGVEELADRVVEAEATWPVRLSLRGIVTSRSVKSIAHASTRAGDARRSGWSSSPGGAGSSARPRRCSPCQTAGVKYTVRSSAPVPVRLIWFDPRSMPGTPGPTSPTGRSAAARCIRSRRRTARRPRR
jgi:hypothetical protein